MFFPLTQQSKLMESTSQSTSAEIVAYLLNNLLKHDACTFLHSCRVQKLAVNFAMQLELPADMIEDISIAALLHDIGKITIPSSLLKKPGKLNEAEFSIIKKHSEAGYKILKNTILSPDIAETVLYHHEKYNGTGYPRGGMGENIPLLSRIVSITDVYEAITSDRVYRKAMAKKEALQVIYKGAEAHFDPELVNQFLIMMSDKEIRIKG